MKSAIFRKLSEPLYPVYQPTGSVWFDRLTTTEQQERPKDLLYTHCDYALAGISTVITNPIEGDRFGEPLVHPLEATTDPVVVAKWREENPWAGIGIPMLQASLMVDKLITLTDLVGLRTVWDPFTGQPCLEPLFEEGVDPRDAVAFAVAGYHDRPTLVLYAQFAEKIAMYPDDKILWTAPVEMADELRRNPRFSRGWPAHMLKRCGQDTALFALDIVRDGRCVIMPPSVRISVPISDADRRL